MTGLALMALLLTTPQQVEVRSQHQLVSVDSKTWRWVRPGVPLSLDVKRSGDERLAVEVIRLGTPGTEAKSERVDVRIGKKQERISLKLKLQGNRAVPGQGSLRMSYSVRHRFRVPTGKIPVVITASAKQSPFGFLVRTSLSEPKATADEGGLALAPLGALPPADTADKADKPKKRKRRRGRKPQKKPADAPVTDKRPSKDEGKPATAPVAEAPVADQQPSKDEGKPVAAPAPTAAAPLSAASEPVVSRPGPPEAAAANAADPDKASASADASPAAEASPPPAPASDPPPDDGREGREGREDREGREGASPTEPADAPTVEAPVQPTVEPREERPTEAPAAEDPQPTVEHRPERPAEQPAPLPADAPTESVEVIELVPEEPRALLGPRQLGTGVPLLVEAQLAPGLIVQPFGGLSNVATSGGLRLLVGVNLGFFSRFTYGVGVDVDFQAAATSPGTSTASVRWQTGQLRLRLEGAFDVLRLDIGDLGRLHMGVLGGVGGIVGAHWLSQGTDVVSHPMIGPTARLGITGGFTVGPGSVTLSLPVDWSYGVGFVRGYAPLAATFFLGYRLEL